MEKIHHPSRCFEVLWIIIFAQICHLSELVFMDAVELVHGSHNAISRDIGSSSVSHICWFMNYVVIRIKLGIISA